MDLWALQCDRLANLRAKHKIKVNHKDKDRGQNQGKLQDQKTTKIAGISRRSANRETRAQMDVNFRLEDSHITPAHGCFREMPITHKCGWNLLMISPA